MRWDEQRPESDLRLPGVGDGTVVRTFDAPEAMGIKSPLALRDIDLYERMSHESCW